MLPHYKRVIRSACNYYAGREEEYPTSMAMPVTSTSMPASSDDDDDASEVVPADPMAVWNGVERPHCLTHQPASHNFVYFSMAKIRLVRKHKGVSATVATPYGHNMAMGHPHITEGFGPAAMGGRPWFLCNRDRANPFGYAGPTQSTDGYAVPYQMAHAVGYDTIGMVYAAGGYGIIRACKSRGLTYDLSTLGMRETIAVAGTDTHGVQYCMHVLLVRAGLPAVLCCDAAHCYLMLLDIGDMVPHPDYYPGMTKWHARTGAPFNGQVIPFGCAASYSPTKEIYVVGNAAPRTRVGICMGERLRTQTRWSVSYVVLDIVVGVGKHRGVDAHGAWGTIYHQVTKRVDPTELY